MCELMGMTANTPTDICFSITGLMERGGRTGPHRDGWGVAFYHGKGIREFRDPTPGVSSHIASLVKTYPIKADIVISHIRQANSGKVCLENTHPFRRELWGRHWCFAHNGQLKGIKRWPMSFYRPVGNTDSEHAFCWLINGLREQFADKAPGQRALYTFLQSRVADIAKHGVFNFLLSDSEYLYAFCSTRLSWITRKAPFGTAHLKDAEMAIDFKQKTTPNDIVTVVATEPLTDNEIWQRIEPGQLLVFRQGRLVNQMSVEY